MSASPSTSTGPSTKLGIETPASAATIAAKSAVVFCLTAAKMPKTSSGKLKRGQMRERYLAGRLGERHGPVETGAVILRSWLGHLGRRRRRPGW